MKRRSLDVRPDSGGSAARVSWSQTKRRGIRFVVLLGVLMAGFSAVFHVWLVRSDPFLEYLELNAAWSGAIVNTFGGNVSVSGPSISTSRFSMSVQFGCEAGQVGAFFVLAVLLWPGRTLPWRRLVGLPFGLLVLSLINLVRIVSLYYTGAYFPRAFETVHLDVWQPAFIALALFLWIVWIRWATNLDGVRPGVA